MHLKEFTPNDSTKIGRKPSKWKIWRRSFPHKNTYVQVHLFYHYKMYAVTSYKPPSIQSRLNWQRVPLLFSLCSRDVLLWYWNFTRYSKNSIFEIFTVRSDDILLVKRGMRTFTSGKANLLYLCLKNHLFLFLLPTFSKNLYPTL